MSRNHPPDTRSPFVVGEGRRPPLAGGTPVVRPSTSCAICGAMSFARCSLCQVAICDAECAYVHQVSAHPRRSS